MAVDEHDRDLVAELGTRLRELRERRGLRQEDVAAFVGFSDKSAVSKKEAGQQDIGVKYLHAWARCLAARVELLIWPDEDANAGLFASVVDLHQDDQELLAEFAATLGVMDANTKRGLRRMFAEIRSGDQT